MAAVRACGYIGERFRLLRATELLEPIMRCRNLLRASCLLAALCGFPLVVHADAGDLHSWQISEIWSDPTGTYQFVEMHETSNLNNQHTLSGSATFPQPKHLVSNTHDYIYTTDLPSNATANKYFLSATPGFASLPGAVTPDFIIPANFFTISGDTISFPTFASFTFTSGELPTDWVHSLLSDDNVVVNSPTNFAGQTGSVTEPVIVPEPSTLGMFAVGSAMLLGLWRRRARR